MFKKLALAILSATAISTPCMAVTINNSLQSWATIEYELQPNEAQVFSNYMFWPVEANCKISTEDDNNVLHAVALTKKGKLNDIPWIKGDTLRLTIHHGETLKINADPGAQVSITNEGLHAVKATCIGG
ncbi:MAG: hypothetical protein CK426_02585 [Legionella sp.]|nr:MAG: hypothetical protein CK423_03385 [Legionella sp.]PJD99683.1 MAG: hypothetical protein CK426_02585 [Legionella sp.]